jgi:EmrB/QacA subfamily drug resistance transporter
MLSTPTADDKRNVIVVFGALLLTQFLSGLDTIILVTALPTIVGDLGGLRELSWVLTVYMLTSTASSPIIGKLSDLMGRKTLFQLSLLVFLGGSALSGFSHSINQLIAFRAVQGIGAGGLGVLSRTIVADIVPGRQLGRYQGIMTSSFAVSSVAGPLVGGLIVDHTSWRWIFYVNLPLGLLALIVASVALKTPRTRRQVKIDYGGSALLVASVVAFLLATTWAGTRYGWSSAEIIGLIVGGFALAAVFVYCELRAREPIMPTRLFRNRIYTVASGSGFVLGMAMFGPWVVMPIFLQVVTGVSATNSGLLLLPLLGSFTLSSVCTGLLITRTGRYRIFPIIGTSLMFIGFLLYTRIGLKTTRLETSLYMVVVGAGIGLMLEVLTIAVQNSAAPEDLGAATAGVGFFNSIGGAFGTAICLSIMNSGLAKWLPRLVPAGVHLRASVLEGSPSQIKALAPAVHNGVVRSFDLAIHTVFLCVVPLAAIGFVMVLFLREVPLRDVSVGDLLAARQVQVALDEGTAAPFVVQSEIAVDQRVALIQGAALRAAEEPIPTD